MIQELNAELVGFEGVNYQLQWQYTPDGGETIIDVEGATGLTYSFPVTQENAGYLWRLSVQVVQPDAAE